MALQGDAGFKYTPTGGSLTTVTLAAPLKDLHPSQVQTHYVRESLDLSTREITTIGSGVYEITATIRFAGDPQGLIDMLVSARNGVTLTYYPSLAVTGTSYACLLILSGPVELVPDSDRYGFGEYQTTVQLRRTSGATWEAVL
jgi:hypothetical protein